MNELYRFTDNNASFSSFSADRVRTLYFPLCNENIMSSISPNLRGDIKSGQDSFLLPPASRIDLTNSMFSRNFWVYAGKEKVWSATGVSKDLKTIKEDSFTLEAGLLWHKVTRKNEKIGLKAEVLSFVPSSGEPVELMQVTITNISHGKLSFIPTAAIPIYARGANNIRDHRHVTSLLQRIIPHKFGVISKPTLSFDEAGHRRNERYYFVLGWDENGAAPQHIYPTQEAFCGESGDLESPESIFDNRLPGKANIQGKEPMGGLRFKLQTLAKGQSCSYTLVMGITAQRDSISSIINKFKSANKVSLSLEGTKRFWAGRAIGSDNPGERDFDNWFRWVSVQPVLRKIFGCSFLPDFDYGKGGRGWRDLWQDCLGLMLRDAKEVRKMLVNNFLGVRLDGSNATIIGKTSGEFVADRNDIQRVWMDHGVWPLITTELYISRFKDESILFEKAGYFSDRHVWRTLKINNSFKPCRYKGTVLEHLILQNIAQFFNVGRHNHIRLEGADWNDGLDMASQEGESVSFSCMYASNLRKIAQLIRLSGKDKIALFREIGVLLGPCRYESVKDKRRILEQYFAEVENGISGKMIYLQADRLAENLEDKAEWMLEHIRRSEWLAQGFFNGYYDNKGKRVEGKIGGRIRMSLVSQTFAIMSGVAAHWQIEEIIRSVKKYLYDKKIKGYRLNTDFGSEYPDLGRAFSFAYGEKENGAVFSHMVVMYAYALSSRGFVKEAREVLYSLYKLSTDTEKSRIYPCLPEYFNAEGRGMYAYLTGSASWYILSYFSLPK